MINHYCSLQRNHTVSVDRNEESAIEISYRYLINKKYLIINNPNFPD